MSNYITESDLKTVMKILTDRRFVRANPNEIKRICDSDKRYWCAYMGLMDLYNIKTMGDTWGVTKSIVK